MNLPSLKRALPLFALLAIALVLILLQRFDSAFFASRRYAECSHLVASDPQKALALAHGWRAQKPESPVAKHCEALALFATKDYTDAGNAFAALAKQVTVSNPALSAELFLQSAKSYEAGGKIDLAKESAVSALLVQPGNESIKSTLDEIGKRVIK
jgi:tetratricopeptide (TPR) repeat protein